MVRRLAVLSALVCLFAVVTTGTVWSLGRSAGHLPAGAAGSSTPLEAGATSGAPAGRTPGPGRSLDPAATAGSRAREVLASWDRSRATAWARGDVAGLRDLYVAGSRTGRRDVQMLGRWVRRDLRVVGMTTQVRTLEVLRWSARRGLLRVTDRLVGATAVGPSSRHRLPEDGWTERRIDLRRTGGGWRVVEVRESASP